MEDSEQEEVWEEEECWEDEGYYLDEDGFYYYWGEEEEEEGAPAPVETKAEEDQEIGGEDPIEKPPFVSDDWVLQKQLGIGAFGSVWQVQGKNGEEAALKCIKAQNMIGMKTTVEQEVEIMKSFNHEGICKCFGVTKNKDGDYFMILELLKGGALLANLAEEQHYNEETARSVVRQTCAALAYMHESKVPFFCRFPQVTVVVFF